MIATANSRERKGMEKTKVCPYRNKHEMCEKPNSKKNGTLCLFDKAECKDKKSDSNG